MEKKESDENGSRGDKSGRSDQAAPAEEDSEDQPEVVHDIMHAEDAESIVLEPKQEKEKEGEQEEANPPDTNRQLSDLEKAIEKCERKVRGMSIDPNTYGCIHMFEKHPCVIICIVMVFSLACGAWVLFDDLFHYSEPKERDFLVRNEDNTMFYDAVYLAQKEVYSMQSGKVMKQSQVNAEWVTHLVVLSKIGKTVFSQENIKCIRSVADELRTLPGIEQFCLKDNENDTKCSPTEFMRGVVFSFGDEMEDDEVQSKLAELQKIPENRAYLEKGITMASTFSNVTRVIFRFAMPISVEGENYQDRNDRKDEQEEKFKEFCLKMRNFVGSVKDPELKFYIYSDALYEKIYLDYIIDDSEFLAGTGIFLFVYLWFRCESFFLAFAGFIQVLLSFPLAFMIYNPLFGVKYIGIVHVIAIYIGLVVSCENMILVVSHWKHGKRYEEHKKLLRHRMAFALRKSFGPITASTAVTLLAFFSTAFCGIMPISSFSIAMALIIASNYLLLFTYFPCIIFFYWEYIRKLCDWIDYIRKLVNPKHEKYELARRQTMIHKGHSMTIKEQQKPESSESDEEVRKAKKVNLGFFESFFGECFGPTLSKLSIIVLLIFLGWMIYMIYMNIKIPSLSRPDQMLPDDYEITQSKHLVEDAFGHGDGDNNVVVRFVYGIDGVNTDQVSYYDSTSIGELEWDRSFNLTPEASQQYLLDVCSQLKNDPVYVDYIRGSNAISCFMQDFVSFAKTQMEVAETVPEANFSSLLYQFAKEDERGKHYKRSYQINFDQNHTLLFAQIFVETSTARFLEQDEMKKVYNRWEGIHNSFRSKAPAGMQKSFQTAMFHWSFIETESALINNVYIGISVSLTSSFVFLSLGTMNVLVALFATISIGGIFTCVMAIYSFFDWEFGTLESIMSIVVLVFVVRFIFLISFGYTDNNMKKRYDKTNEAMKTSGGSIIHSTLSTIGSAIFIYLCIVVVLERFGIIICFTVMYSILFSLLFLPSGLYLMGPNRGIADISCMFKCRKEEAASVPPEAPAQPPDEVEVEDAEREEESAEHKAEEEKAGDVEEQKEEQLGF